MPAVVVGASAVQLSSTDTTAPRGVLVKAREGNSGTIAVGFSSDVTVNSAAATDGMPLAAGASLFIPPSRASNLASVWVIATASSQNLDYLKL